MRGAVLGSLLAITSLAESTGFSGMVAYEKYVPYRFKPAQISEYVSLEDHGLGSMLSVETFFGKNRNNDLYCADTRYMPDCVSGKKTFVDVTGDGKVDIYHEEVDGELSTRMFGRNNSRSPYQEDFEAYLVRIAGCKDNKFRSFFDVQGYEYQGFLIDGDDEGRPWIKTYKMAEMFVADLRYSAMIGGRESRIRKVFVDHDLDFIPESLTSCIDASCDYISIEPDNPDIKEFSNAITVLTGRLF
ncbi:hypothetical protein H6504_01900 [Candidatus Woesearchaeota archaeon]|nr:hypothetical protein [Candidatus Woesearchaeota archaeon]